MTVPCFRFPFVTLVCASALLSPQVVSADSNCASNAEVRQVLEDRFGETRQRIGSNEAGQIIEIYASSQTGSWTLVTTFPGGVSCLMASGRDYARDLSGLQVITTASN